MKREAQVDDAREARRIRRATKTLQWKDLDTDEAPNTFCIPTPVLRERVIPFLAPFPVEGLWVLNKFDPKQHRKHLRLLRLICKHWYMLAEWFENKAAKRSLGVVNSANVGRVARRLEDDGSEIRQLTLSVHRVLETAAWLGFFRSVWT